MPTKILHLGMNLSFPYNSASGEKTGEGYSPNNKLKEVTMFRLVLFFCFGAKGSRQKNIAPTDRNTTMTQFISNERGLKHYIIQ